MLHFKILMAGKSNEKVTRSERGCIDYAYSVEMYNPNAVRITELWKDLKSLEDHLKSDHVLNFINAISKNPPKFESHFYEAKEIPNPGQI